MPAPTTATAATTIAALVHRLGSWTTRADEPRPGGALSASGCPCSPSIRDSIGMRTSSPTPPSVARPSRRASAGRAEWSACGHQRDHVAAEALELVHQLRGVTGLEPHLELVDAG